MNVKSIIYQYDDMINPQIQIKRKGWLVNIK